MGKCMRIYRLGIRSIGTGITSREAIIGSLWALGEDLDIWR